MLAEADDATEVKLWTEMLAVMNPHIAACTVLCPDIAVF